MQRCNASLPLHRRKGESQLLNFISVWMTHRSVSPGRSNPFVVGNQSKMWVICAMKGRRIKSNKRILKSQRRFIITKNRNYIKMSNSVLHIFILVPQKVRSVFGVWLKPVLCLKPPDATFMDFNKVGVNAKNSYQWQLSDVKESIIHRIVGKISKKSETKFS